MDLTWEKSVRRSDGGDFKFQGVSVPASLRSQHGLKDGDEVTVVVEFGGSEERITKTLTSGGEVAIDKPIREKILDYAIKNPTSTVRYTLVLDAKNMDYLSHRARENAVREGDEKVRDALTDEEARKLRLETAPSKPASRIVALR
jgi:bifunctional DNA-binding transcriptional regulator/antitoxin component of YhaV-PrlF toxin-antitoxin module